MGTDRHLLLEIPDALDAPRVVVRPYADADAVALHAAIHEAMAHLKPWMPWYDRHATLDQTRAYVRRTQADWLLRAEFHMGIFEREGDTLLGGIGLHALDWRIPAFEIGYWLRPPAEGRGYMSEAARALTAFAFDRLGAERLVIRCDARNERSARLAERLGYLLEGRLRHAGLDTAGRLCDTLLYAMTPHDYVQARTRWEAEPPRRG